MLPSRVKKRIAFFCLVSFAAFALHPAATAQDGSKELQIKNEDWRVENNTAIIVFDLLGASGQEYEIGIRLLSEDDENFEIIPKSIRGDSGKGILPGAGKTIRWDFVKDVSTPLSGDRYFFEIRASRATGGSSFLWYAVGGAAAAGVAAVLLLGKKTEEAPAQQVQELPLPPIRP